KLLWRRPGFETIKTSWGGWLGDVPVPMICDPKSDGHPMVFIADQVLPPGGAPGLRTEVLALDGKSGKLEWSWHGGDASQSIYIGPLEAAQSWRDASPQLVRTAAGPALV